MRVLFIGAIRRNGYATARALRELGLDCEILLPRDLLATVFYEHQLNAIPGWVRVVDALPSNLVLRSIARLKHNFGFYGYNLVHSRCLGALSYIKLGVPYVEQSVGSDMREAAVGPGLLARRILRHYRRARKLVISQPDHVGLCERLGLKNYVYVPLLADTENYFPDKQDGPRFEGYDLTVFHPTHLDWTYSHGDRSPKKGNDKGYRSSTKGNDRLIRAFARLVESKVNALLIILRRGIDIAETGRLIGELGIEKNVLWLDEMDNIRLRKYFSGIDIMADQFDCGSLGLTAYDAMLCSTPIMGYMDEECAQKCYPEQPPVMNCRTEDEIYRQLSNITASKIDEMGERSRAWVLENHSPQRVARLFRDIYLEA